MRLRDYKVDYRDYINITEPMIYIWEEESGRIIARVFSTGEKAENCRLNYARKTKQLINWCMGVFPVDTDRDEIKEWYPEVEFQDELVKEGRIKKKKSKQEDDYEHFEDGVMISAIIPKTLKDKLDNYVLGTGKMQREVITEAISKMLEGKEQIIEQIRRLQELL